MKSHFTGNLITLAYGSDLNLDKFYIHFLSDFLYCLISIAGTLPSPCKADRRFKKKKIRESAGLLFSTLSLDFSYDAMNDPDFNVQPKSILSFVDSLRITDSK